MAHDLRMVRRWARVDPGDGDEHGDAVPTFIRCDRILFMGFTPQTHVLGGADNRFDEGQVLQRAFAPYCRDFRVGDRIGPAHATAPDMDVYSVADYPTGQNLEVRPL